MNLRGKKVTHSKFGDGKIVDIKEYPDAKKTILNVRFRDRERPIDKKQLGVDLKFINEIDTNEHIREREIGIYNALKTGIVHTIVKNKIMQTQIDSFLVEHEIKSLVHFTRLENLASIMRWGFVSVKLQKESGIVSIRNDEQRLDRKLGYTSFSVEFPNHKLFYSYRSRQNTSNWVVISISADVLFNNDSIYCISNAAGKATKGSDIDDFRAMYSDSNKPRPPLIPKEYTTDPQAEILIKGHINRQYINSVYFISLQAMDEYLTENNPPYAELCKAEPSFFNHRIDYKQWKTEEEVNWYG